ncbi:MAG: gamma-glutamylcyclotransferase [Candidatus Brocadiia bacterium]
MKCDAEKTGKASDKLWIAVFDIRKCEESNLDSAEGLGHGYRKETVNLTVAGKNLGVKIYLADEDAIVDDVPYEWYKKMVLLGAEYHSFPNSYLRSIQDVESKRDNRPEAKEEWDTVKRMQANRKRQR